MEVCMEVLYGGLYGRFNYGILLSTYRQQLALEFQKNCLL